MRVNEEGLEIIKRFEGLSLKPYLCPAGVPTIGFGHTAGVRLDSAPITEAEAEELLLRDVRIAEDVVRSNVFTMLNVNQFSALTSFVFNVGAGKRGVKSGFVTLMDGRPSTLRTLINRGEFEGAADEMLRWNRGGGKLLAGLTTRRQAERALFLKPVQEEA